MVFDQLGVPYSELSGEENLNDFSLIIHNGGAVSSSLLTYIKCGGSVVDTKGDLLKHLKIRTQKKFTLSTTVKNLSFSNEPEQLDIFSIVTYVDKQIASINRIDDGVVAHFGISFEKVFRSTTPLRKQFFVPFRRNPAEEISAISKGGVTRLFESLLKELCFRKGLPYIHKAFYPNSQPPLLFRIDSDFTSEDKAKKWNSDCKKNGIRTSWYLHTEAHEEWISTFSEFTEDEIGVHCYKHLSKNSREDIAFATKLLNESGISPHGYSAPYGIWNPIINEVSSEMGFEYSSEFELIYDSLPIPSIPDDPNSLLQIPIHPLCIGSFKSFNIPNDLILDYFEHQIDLQLFRNGPVTLYDHLTHEYSNVMLDILSKAINKECESMTFIAYAEFWKKRLQSSFSVNVKVNENDKYNIESSIPLFIWKSHTEYQRWSEGVMSGILIRPELPTEFPQNFLHRFNPKLHYISLCNRLFWRINK